MLCFASSYHTTLCGEAYSCRIVPSCSFDHTATTTGAVIVPGCGFDSVPSDIAVFLANRTLKNALGPQTQLGLSQSFFNIKGGFSGGTMASMAAEIEVVPADVAEESERDYALSPGTSPLDLS